MKTIHVIIEPGKDGFGVTFKAKGLESISSFGETLEEAKANALEALKEMMDYYAETGKELPKPLKGIGVNQIKFRYSFLLNYYFKGFSYLNISKLASTIGINSSLMRQYDKGLAQASESKFFEIRNGLKRIGKELISVV